MSFFHSVSDHHQIHMRPVFEIRHTVYSVKHVTAIPLIEDRARTVLSTLASRHHVNPRQSLIPPEPADTIPVAENGTTDVTSAGESTNSAESTSPHVKFANDPQVEVMIPLVTKEFGVRDEGTPPSPSSSVTSTPSSEHSLNTDAVVKTLTARLSFWDRLSKRTSVSPSSSAETEHRRSAESEASDAIAQDRQEPFSLDSMIEDGSKESEQVIESILNKTAPSPPTTEEKRTELEDKIVRECVREFTRGGMYFAYNFGAPCVVVE